MGPLHRAPFNAVDMGRETEAKPGAEGNKVCDRQASSSLLHFRPLSNMNADCNNVGNHQVCEYSPL